MRPLPAVIDEEGLGRINQTRRLAIVGSRRCVQESKSESPTSHMALAAQVSENAGPTSGGAALIVVAGYSY